MSKDSKLSITRMISTVVTIVFLSSNNTTFAQSPPILEEIIVTSQKRSESLADVPISVSVVSQETLQTANINKVADLTEYIPNLTMTETGISTQMYIRGIGSGNNQGFEQSVGQYIDGIYYGRQQLIRAPFFDFEQIEVLRGPQGTLFGKNTIAGALNFTTAKPTTTLQAEAKALYEVESEQREINAMITGPLSDTLRARLAFRGYQEDGYIKNTFKHRDEPSRDETAGRLTVDWDITNNLLASLKIERDTFNVLGRQVEIVRDDPNLSQPGLSPLSGLNYNQILSALGQPPMEPKFNYERQANADEFSDTELNNITLNLDYILGNNTLTLVSGLIDYSFSEHCDCDYTPTSIFEIRLSEEYEQFSQEIRLSSATGEVIEWMVGGFYQTTDMHSNEGVIIPADTIFVSLAENSTDHKDKALASLAGTTAQRLNVQESKSWAIFGQASWEFHEDFSITLGARYTEENKNASRRMDVIDTETQIITSNPRIPLVYLAAFNMYTEQALFSPTSEGLVSLPGHKLQGSRSETSFTPLINLQWFTFDNTMLYASASRGFKAGGFDARANNPFSFEFEEEETTSIELGAKSTLANGAVELNIALFFTDYENLQVSQFDGTLGFNVGNAKNTEVKGIEVDGRWATTDHLTMSYAYSYLNFEFTDFINGNCYNRQTPDSIIVNDVALCNYTGSNGKYTPKHSLSLSFDYYRPLSNGLDLVSTLAFNFVGKQNIHDNLDPLFTIDSSTRVNFQVGLESQNWSVALIGKNLTNEKILTYVGNAPLSTVAFGTNSFYGFVGRPRQLAVEAGYRF